MESEQKIPNSRGVGVRETYSLKYVIFISDEW